MRWAPYILAWFDFALHVRLKLLGKGSHASIVLMRQGAKL